jgi:hypothetical protein
MRFTALPGAPRARSLRPVLAALALALPGAASARLGLLDETLSPPSTRPADLAAIPAPLVVAAADDKGAKGKPAAPAPGSLDFDLLGAPPPQPNAPSAASLRLRRRMLTAHQAIGIGLLGLSIANTLVGQLNYSDKFQNGPNTGRYQLSHAVLAYSTLGVFAVGGAVALLAPSPTKKPLALDRVMVHRIALFTAAAGMLTQGLLGVYTSSREGYLDQERIATTHLAIGYATMAAIAVGVGALVF